MALNKNSEIVMQLRKNWSNSGNGQLNLDSDVENERDEDDDEQKDMYFDILGHHKSSYGVTEVKKQNAVKLVLEKEAYCFDVKLFAEKFVEAIFIEANKILIQAEVVTFPNVPVSQFDEIIDFNNQEEVLEKPFSSVKFNHSLNVPSAPHWPKNSEFNIKLGLDKVENYVKQWKRSDDWQFCVEFLGFECEDCSNIFIYEVEWSKPTMSYPVPQATASVYFALEVYKIVPYNYDRCIEVTYIFECSSVIHRPGRINFQEKWLEDIIEAKLKFFKTITFSVPKGLCDKSNPEIPQILQ